MPLFSRDHVKFIARSRLEREADALGNQPTQKRITNRQQQTGQEGGDLVQQAAQRLQHHVDVIASRFLDHPLRARNARSGHPAGTAIQSGRFAAS